MLCLPARYIKMSTLLYFRLGTCSLEVFDSWHWRIKAIICNCKGLQFCKYCRQNVINIIFMSFQKRKKLSKKIDLGKFLQARLFLLTTSSSSHIFLPPRKNHISKKDLLGSKPLWNQIGIFPPLYILSF